MRQILFTLLMILPINLIAQIAEEQGLTIATEADKRDQGWRDSKAEMRMILSNKQGESSERQMM